MDYPCHSKPKAQWCDRFGPGDFMGHTCQHEMRDAGLSIEEKLILLVEECGEVIQAATKCLRFGWDRNQPDYGVNHEVLAKEIGDLLGVIDALPLRRDLINMFQRAKMAKAERVRRELARGPQ
jgi:NTP pyrophosphatase (non-canonical NTP hydrolase)